jgi:hypothetical protein
VELVIGVFDGPTQVHENRLKGTGFQAAEKLCFVSGHDFSRAVNVRIRRALQAAEKLVSF